MKCFISRSFHSWQNRYGEFICTELDQENEFEVSEGTGLHLLFLWNLKGKLMMGILHPLSSLETKLKYPYSSTWLSGFPI